MLGAQSLHTQTLTYISQFDCVDHFVSNASMIFQFQICTLHWQSSPIEWSRLCWIVNEVFVGNQINIGHNHLKCIFAQRVDGCAMVEGWEYKNTNVISFIWIQYYWDSNMDWSLVTFTWNNHLFNAFYVYGFSVVSIVFASNLIAKHSAVVRSFIIYISLFMSKHLNIISQVIYI